MTDYFYHEKIDKKEKEKVEQLSSTKKEKRQD